MPPLAAPSTKSMQRRKPVMAQYCASIGVTLMQDWILEKTEKEGFTRFMLAGKAFSHPSYSDGTTMATSVLTRYVHYSCVHPHASRPPLAIQYTHTCSAAMCDYTGWMAAE